MPSHVQPSVRRSVFAPLHVGGRVEAVERRLTDAIRAGMLVDGEQLPSEQELAAQLGVATVTLREALAGLRRRGLVRTRRGRNGGTFVRVEPETRRAYLLERLRELAADELRDMGDHQRAIAVETARLAAARASEADLEMLRRHVGALAAARSDGARHAADWRFHVELAAAARSTRLAEAEAELQVDAGAMLWFAAGPEQLAAAREEHAAILAAVEAGDAEAAGRLMGAHCERETAALIGARLRELGGAAEGRPASGAALPGSTAAERRAAAEAVLAPLVEAVEGIFAGAGRLRDETLALHAAGRAEGRALRRADLAPVRQLIHEQLEAPASPLYGAGVVFAPELLEDAPRWLEWWWTPVDRPVQLETVLEPDDSRYYDYEHAHWFAAPRDTGGRWIAGPFVDYSGTDRHIFTLTVPVLADGGAFLGVAGADVTASRMEQLAAPGLLGMGADAALLNRRGRVIASNSARWLPGAICAEVEEDELDEARGPWTERPDGSALLRCPALQWAVLVGAGARPAPTASEG